MSITKMRKGFAAAGPPVAIVLGIAFVVGFLYYGPMGQAGSGEKDTRGVVAFVVDGHEVYTGELAETVGLFEKHAVQQSGAIGAPDIRPSEALDFRTNAFLAEFEGALLLAMANDEDINLDEDGAKQWAEGLQIQQFQASSRAAYENQTQALQQNFDRLKKEKGASAAETKSAEKALADHKALTVDQFFSRQSGATTVEEFAREKLEEQLADPFARRSLMSAFASDEIRKKYAASVDASDEALRRSYDQVTYQQILISVENNADPQAKAEEVLKRIRGGMKFEDAVAQFSERKDAKGKPDKGVETLPRLDILAAGSYSSILDLKPGEVSGIIELPAGAAIYKLIGAKPNVPKDFEVMKGQRAEAMRSQIGSALFRQALQARRKAAANKTEWKDEGWKLLFEFRDLLTGERASRLRGKENREKRIKAFRELLDKTYGAPCSDYELPGLIRYAAFSQISAETPPGPEKEKLKELQLEVYESLADQVGSTSFRFEYVTLLVESKRGDDALAQLLDLAKSAFTPGEAGENMIRRVEKLLPEATKAASKGSPVIGQIRKEIEKWREEQAELKRMEEEQKKLEAEERERSKKEEAELRKAEQPKPPGGGG